ncbi:MAG: hypothetical protein QMC81_01630 [Thermoanaerobacterales bacterium]|nr:hypothetical protein [Bacillota bacterium]MDI6906174.1 hypothetical protein [Thermoanaerobacterales bacterium]
MIIIPEDIEEMAAAIAGRCPKCGQWAGVIVKRFSSPWEALADQDWPDITCETVTCCNRHVYPTHFLVIYQGTILREVEIGGPDMPVTRREIH